MLSLGSERLGRSFAVRRAARARGLVPPGGRGSEPWHDRQDGAFYWQAAAALQPASICSVCSVVQWSSLSESGLEMCVPMFLRP